MSQSSSGLQRTKLYCKAAVWVSRSDTNKITTILLLLKNLPSTLKDTVQSCVSQSSRGLMPLRKQGRTALEDIGDRATNAPCGTHAYSRCQREQELNVVAQPVISALGGQPGPQSKTEAGRGECWGRGEGEGCSVARVLTGITQLYLPFSELTDEIQLFHDHLKGKELFVFKGFLSARRENTKSNTVRTNFLE